MTLSVMFVSVWGLDMKMFSIYDEAAKFFGPPISAPNAEMIRRTVRQMVADGVQVPFLQYPDEFVVYFVGEFDEDSGCVTGLDSPPERIAKISELMAQSAP